METEKSHLLRQLPKIWCFNKVKYEKLKHNPEVKFFFLPPYDFVVILPSVLALGSENVANAWAKN